RHAVPRRRPDARRPLPRSRELRRRQPALLQADDARDALRQSLALRRAAAADDDGRSLRARLVEPPAPAQDGGLGAALGGAGSGAAQGDERSLRAVDPRAAPVQAELLPARDAFVADARAGFD